MLPVQHLGVKLFPWTKVNTLGNLPTNDTLRDSDDVGICNKRESHSTPIEPFLTWHSYMVTPPLLHPHVSHLFLRLIHYASLVLSTVPPYERQLSRDGLPGCLLTLVDGSLVRIWTVLSDTNQPPLSPSSLSSVDRHLFVSRGCSWSEGEKKWRP